MVRRRRYQLAVLALTAVLGAGCGSDSPGSTGTQPEPSPQSAIILSQIFTELTLPALTGPSAYGMAVTSKDIADITGCVYTASALRFLCPDITSSAGLKLTKSFTLRDGSGAAQTAFDENTTGTIRIKSTLTGPIAGALATDATQEFELAGLRSGTHTFSGNSTATVTGVIDPVTHLPVTHYFITSVSDLLIPLGATSSNIPAWPTRGKITAQDSATMQGALPSRSSFEVSFSGSSRVSVIILTSGGTQICSMDLATLPLLCR